MNDKRKELFRRWKLLSKEIEELSAVVQNDVEFLTDKDIEKFNKDYNAIKINLEDLGDKTRKYINKKRDKYEPGVDLYETFKKRLENLEGE